MNIRILTDLERKQAEELRILRAAMWAIATSPPISSVNLITMAQAALMEVGALG